MTGELKITEQNIKEILETVTDPEIPVLTIFDLGIVREIEVDENNKIKITITPTYTGCPAMDVININIRMALLENGFKDFEIINTLSPAWTTDWMSDAGKKKLKAYGIAPPNPKPIVCTFESVRDEEAVQCPHCDSYNTQLVSRFGSTACKALYKCNHCHEPFEYFKSH